MLANLEPVELLARVFQGALPFRQVLDTQAVGVGKEGAGHLRRLGEAVGLCLGEHMPDGNQQPAGDGHDGLGPTQAGFQTLELGPPVRVVVSLTMASLR